VTVQKRYSDLGGDAGSNIVGQVMEQRDRVRSRMAHVARTVAVMSGKGGVGKSVITANLAAALAARGHAVGALDADLSGPCLARMLGAGEQSLRIGERGVVPAGGVGGVRVMSMDLLLAGDETPLVWDDLDGAARAGDVWRGAMELSALREFLADTDWGELDFLFIDLPPGTQPLAALTALLPELDGVIVVSIPSDVARLVVGKSVTAARERRTPILGLVENMAGYHCQRCGEVGELFPAPAGQAPAAEALGVPSLGQVPFDPGLARSADGGRPFILDAGDSPAARALTEIVDRIEQLPG